MTLEQIGREALETRLLKAGPDTLLLDLRSEADYLLGHLPGAVSLPMEHLLPVTSREQFRRLVPEFHAGIFLVLYEVGEAGAVAAEAARLLDLQNIEPLLVYQGGFTDWVVAQKPLHPPLKVWGCKICSFGYYAHRGDASQKILPGVLFEQIEETWRCPWCGAPKSAFVVEKPR